MTEHARHIKHAPAIVVPLEQHATRAFLDTTWSDPLARLVKLARGRRSTRPQALQFVSLALEKATLLLRARALCPHVSASRRTSPRQAPSQIQTHALVCDCILLYC